MFPVAFQYVRPGHSLKLRFGLVESIRDMRQFPHKQGKQHPGRYLARVVHTDGSVKSYYTNFMRGVSVPTIIEA